MPTDHLDPRLRIAFKLISLLSILCIGLIAAVFILLNETAEVSGTMSPDANTALGPTEFVRDRYPDVDFRAIYPDRALDEIFAIQDATFAVRLGYAPFIEFRPLPIKNPYVNISAAGFRANKSLPPWPLDTNRFNIFVFGGSTTFGYGVPDSETVVSFLEEELNANSTDRFTCYNFGAAYYFSTQERLLFEQLLEAAHRPDMVIFVDGLNDFGNGDGRPVLTPKLHNFVTPDIPYTNPLSITNLAALLSALELTLDRYQFNLKLIQNTADSEDIATMFVAQPVPFFQYSPTSDSYPFGEPSPHFIACAQGYPIFARRFRENAFGPNFFWAGDTFTKVDEPVYCDAIHYNAEGNQLLAHRIANAILTRRMQSNSPKR